MSDMFKTDKQRDIVTLTHCLKNTLKIPGLQLCTPDIIFIYNKTHQWHLIQTNYKIEELCMELFLQAASHVRVSSYCIRYIFHDHLQSYNNKELDINLRRTRGHTWSSAFLQSWWLDCNGSNQWQLGHPILFWQLNQ